MRGDGLGHQRRETFAIDRQRCARRHARRVGRAHDERPEPTHFLFEKADRVVEFVAAEGVAADELGELVGLVNKRRSDRPHLVQDDPHAT
jgi:hypothetical protein